MATTPADNEMLEQWVAALVTSQTRGRCTLRLCRVAWSERARVTQAMLSAKTVRWLRGDVTSAPAWAQGFVLSLDHDTSRASLPHLVAHTS